MGSTTSCEDPDGADVMQSGSITAVTRSRVSGAALAIRKAQARPAMMARWNGRASGCLKVAVADIVDSPSQSFRGAQSVNPESRDSGAGPSDHPGMTTLTTPPGP